MQSGTPTHYRDRSGFAAFSAGEEGAVHRQAHELLDAEEVEEGYRLLTDWLRGRCGDGPRWLHLQWHAAVFALETGRGREALSRYRRYLEPRITEGLVLSDAPSLLWRLELAGLEVDWGAAHAMAVERSHPDGDPYVELHHALALAGARDVERLDQWLDMHMERIAASDGSSPNPLVGVAWGLRAFANGDFQVAGDVLDRTWRQIASFGGSNAQNLLFEEIGDEAELLARPRRGRRARGGEPRIGV